MAHSWQFESPLWAGRLPLRVGEPAGGNLTADEYKFAVTAPWPIIVSFHCRIGVFYLLFTRYQSFGSFILKMRSKNLVKHCLITRPLWRNTERNWMNGIRRTKLSSPHRLGGQRRNRTRSLCLRKPWSYVCKLMNPTTSFVWPLQSRYFLGKQYSLICSPEHPLLWWISFANTRRSVLFILCFQLIHMSSHSAVVRW